MDANSSAELPSDVVDHVVKTWVDVLKVPTVTGGYFTEDDNFINVSTTWSVNDPGKKEAIKFQRNFTLLKSSLSSKNDTPFSEKNLIMNASAATPIDGKTICISRDGSRKAVLLEKINSVKDRKTQFIQIWNSDSLLKSYDLSELDQHENVYTCGDIGSNMAWNEGGDMLAYLAEKKVPKPKPFFSSDVTPDEHLGELNNESTEKKPSGAKGEEYALRQSWGEQMQDMHYSVVVILDIKTNKFNVIDMPADQFPTDIQWVDNKSIIGTSYKIFDWRLGLIYCTNRESRIFQINTDGSNLRFFSASGKAAFCPRVRPDGKFVIWQERNVDEPHNRARNIMGSPIEELAVVCLYQSVPPHLPIYENFPKQCWSRDDDSFFVIVTNEGIQSLISISRCKNYDKIEIKFVSTSSPGIDNLLWIGQNYMLLTRSSILSMPYIELAEISGSTRIALTKSSDTLENTKYSTTKVFGQASIPSMYVGPEGCQAKTVPLIVWVHGGPHACFVDSFVHESTFLARLGYAFLKINYIGSTGASKRDETDDLLGKIGTLDVQDSQDIVEKTLKTFPCIDPERVGVWGGSHGGFLTCHLIAQFPDFYIAAVARNPVCDLNVMIGTSDISDWVYAESGIPFLTSMNTGFVPSVKSVEEAERLFKASPICHVAKVKAATLLCVGTQDLRVPPSQGISFYRALKAYGKTAELRVYPDCHPLSTIPVRIDGVIHAALWFKRFVK